MRVSIQLFAMAREITGHSRIELELEDGISVGALKEVLGARYPRLQSLLRSTRIAVDSNYAVDSDEIPAGAEVAIIPPVSGGSQTG